VTLTDIVERPLPPLQLFDPDSERRTNLGALDRMRAALEARRSQGIAPAYHRLAIIGCGLIGSSIARKARSAALAKTIAIHDATPSTLERVSELGLADEVCAEAGAATTGADLVILAIPVLATREVIRAIAPSLAFGATVTDVGSVKGPVARAMQEGLPDHVHVIPAHPISGTERSGPDAGFADLFQSKWAILTPAACEDTDFLDALSRLAAFWSSLGSHVEIMDPQHHDLVLAVTSHLPHVIAYNIVGTAADLERVTSSEIVKYSAGGFREFTRLAASNPVMWHDICMANKGAVLDVLGRFTEDLQALSRAIRWNDGEELLKLFSKSNEMAHRDRMARGLETPAPPIL
jgi:cyclohexadieny/prephenate dehydrogenase